MIKVVGVRFRQTCKMYYFSPGELEIKAGDGVIVETARGIEYGTVVMGITEMTDDKVVQPLKPVIRIATKEDEAVKELNKKKEKEAFRICEEKIAKHGLEMKLVDVEYTFDGNKVLFYFIADGRIDFRELVKDLASVFRTRIELRQIGVRDETKAKGGIGICGRVLCCHSYLSDFAPVSIKMAKEQNLSLNPTKISGVCGRLMCCLKNEQETYEYLNSQLPSIGETVITDDGLRGDVQSVNVLRQLVKVLIQVDRDEKELREYKVEQLQFRGKKKKGQPAQTAGCSGCGEGCGSCSSPCNSGQAAGSAESAESVAAGKETAASVTEPEQASERGKEEETNAERPAREPKNPENRENRDGRERNRVRGQQPKRENRGEKRNYHENQNRSHGEGRPNGESGNFEKRRENSGRPRKDNRNFENRRENGGEQRGDTNRRNDRGYENRRENSGEPRRKNNSRRYQGNHRQKNTDSQQNNE